MNRRNLLATFATLPFSSTARSAARWQAQWLAGGFDGKIYQAGLYIEMEPGWKTYWRNPGNSGIPPEIKAVGDNLAEFSIDAPLPQRITDESGEAIGFHDEVMFLLNLAPKDSTKPLNVEFTSFFGVCELICTPAKFDGKLSFKPDQISADENLFQQWRGQVPKPAKIISTTKIENKILTIGIKQQVKDIFVEGPETLYFHAPTFDTHGSEAQIRVSGLKNDQDLKGQDLRITFNAMGMGLEQTITVT
jgi:DsbC/DsbD-like thiol-disulfide interchange protein